jgi:hypothetical protein
VPSASWVRGFVLLGGGVEWSRAGSGPGPGPGPGRLLSERETHSFVRSFLSVHVVA